MENRASWEFPSARTGATRRPRRRANKDAPDASSGHDPTETRGGRLLSIHPRFINFQLLTPYASRNAGTDPKVAAALACLESRCGLTKSVDDAYDEFDKKEPWDEVLS